MHALLSIVCWDVFDQKKLVKHTGVYVSREKIYLKSNMSFFLSSLFLLYLVFILRTCCEKIMKRCTEIIICDNQSSCTEERLMIYWVIPTRQYVQICYISHQHDSRIHVKFDFVVKQNACVFQLNTGLWIHKLNRAHNGLKTVFTYSCNILTCK